MWPKFSETPVKEFIFNKVAGLTIYFQNTSARLLQKLVAAFCKI